MRVRDVRTETVEVANILKEMLEDIKTRREIIDKVCDLAHTRPPAFNTLGQRLTEVSQRMK